MSNQIPSLNSNEQILYTTFNQDSSCIAIGTEKGFKIFNTSPLKDNFSRKLDGGIGIIEMLNRSNILALVGGGLTPKFNPNKVIIWDDNQAKILTEIRFTSIIKNIKLKRKKIFVVCEQNIYVFNFDKEFSTFDTIKTFENELGLIGYAQETNINIIAFPDKQIGNVTVKNYDDNNKEITIEAHKGKINCIAMNIDGSLLATASEKGTLIRLFDVKDGKKDLIQELRRGMEKANINCICFHSNSKFLLCSSDRGTIHIFKIKLNENSNDSGNKKSFFSKFNWLNNEYLNSEWSFAQFRIVENKSIATFGKNNEIYVLSSDGIYYKAVFDLKNGGDCEKIEEREILNLKNYEY